MDPVPEPPPNDAPRAAGGPAGASRWMLPKLPLLIGVFGLGAALAGGAWFQHRSDARAAAEIGAIRMEVAALNVTAAGYRERIAGLRWRAEQIRAAATQASDERALAWNRERARCFDTLLARLDQSADEEAFTRMNAQIQAACARRDLPQARTLLPKIPELRFPSAARFRELQHELYEVPLAQLSRQNPAFYRAFRQSEPEAAREDIAALRKELASSDLDAVTPQSLLKLELYSAVAPPGDSLAQDWASLASAPDYFDGANPATLAAWRRAQRAIRREDWQTAIAQMQSILWSTVRTRLPFRAAYARTLLKNRPDDHAAAYPFMEELAASGDAEARSWMVQEEMRRNRPAQALRWLESSVAAGDRDAVPKLLELYARPREAVPRDPAREGVLLHQINVAPDAPPLTSMLLARLAEETPGTPGNAFAYYRQAAEKNHVPAFAQVARCYLRGEGTPVDQDQAIAWACRALAAGEREVSVPVLLELMQSKAERTAGAVELLFENQQIAAPAGFQDVRIHGSSMAQLQISIAAYFDRKGMFAEAARFYANSGSRDPAILARLAALTAPHPCETCHGTGKIHPTAPCPTCDGKGTVVCHVCDGRGYTYVPGTPPCTTCGGTGTVVQQGRVLTCGTCGGTGKGKGSVIRQTCPACTQGRETCHECGGTGRITLTKDCPDCHGTGVRALADS